MNNKFLNIAKLFTRAIQDELQYDNVNDSIIFGQILRTEEEVENYINRAGEIYFKTIIEKAQFKPELIIGSNPELLNSVQLTFPADTLTATHNRKNIYKLIDSGNATAIDNSFIPEMINNNTYFRNKTAIAFDNNYIYKLPKSATNESLTIYYVRRPIQNDGNYFGFNSTEDLVWNEDSFAAIVEIAVKLYRIDDYQEGV